MKTIYYLKQEVKIGDIINFNGLKSVTVTEDLINDNPEYFQVKDEYDIEAILKDAAIRFPIGCKFNNGFDSECESILTPWYGKGMFGQFISVKPYSQGGAVWRDGKWIAERIDPILTTHDGVDLYNNDDSIYLCPSKLNIEYKPWERYKTRTTPLGGINEGWIAFSTPEARQEWIDENYPVLFTTEDGVDIRKGDTCWVTPKHTNDAYFPNNMDAYPAEKTVHNQTLTAVHPDCFSFFSTKESAEAYITKHTEKSLEDYETMLLNLKNYAFYSQLKKREPKLYWLKVLQLIADDLNDEKFKRGSIIEYDKEQDSYVSVWSASNRFRYSDIIFSSRIQSNKAIKIMGDKLDYIYKQ